MSAGTGHGQSVILDANLLVVLFVGLWGPSLVGKRATGDEYRAHDFLYLSQLVARAKSWIVTPHLLTEADDRLDRLAAPGPTECRKLVALFLEPACEQRPKSIRLVREPVYPRIGLADSAIVRVATKHRCSVFTSDRELYSELLRLRQDAYYYPTIQLSLASSERG